MILYETEESLKQEKFLPNTFMYQGVCFQFQEKITLDNMSCLYRYMSASHSKEIVITFHQKYKSVMDIRFN